MLVSHILKSKSDDGVVTVKPGATVAQVAELLSARRIGAVVVSHDGRVVVGIVSERDVVRELGRRGPACLTDRVESLMTAKVTTCARDDTADAVLQRMTEGRFRHLPVIEDGYMVGLISIGDVVKARLSELAMENDALEGMIKGF
ncbi:MAG: CBS domain-containing protein [Cypionkella sp.]